MPNDQFRREDDRRWRERIENLEARVVSLTTSQGSNQSDIDDLATQIADHNQLLHGDRAERDSGLVGQVNQLETRINAVSALLHADSMGHGGLLHEHNELYRKVLGGEKNRDNWFMLAAKIIVTVGSIAAVAISSWPTLSGYWKETSRDMKKLERRIDKVKHPRVPRYPARKVEIIQEAPEATTP